MAKVGVNKLEKNQFGARGTALCHLAIKHGRLFRALLENGLHQEIEFLAKYDENFNRDYNNYFGESSR